MMIRRPNSLARLQGLIRLALWIVTLLMITVFRPGAEDGTLHAFSGTPARAQKAGNVCPGATPDLSDPTVTVDTSCHDKFVMGQSLNTSNNFSLAYKILKSYAETCYDSSQSWRCFGHLDESVQFLSDDKARFGEYREWLKSVLWLNQTDPLWFCTCVQSLQFSYQWDTSIGGSNYNAEMAISYFIQKNHLCTMDSNYYHMGDSATRFQQHRLWLDTCRLYHHDTTQFPMDTTLPSLHDLGLDILINPPQQHASVEFANSALGVLKVSQNPFEDQTEVSFTLPHSLYLSFQVSDVLGRIVLGDYKGIVLSPGEHSFAIEGKALRPGTYYIRLTTANGETRTVKIVKE